MAFDPDRFLAESAPGFNPDAWLAEQTEAPGVADAAKALARGLRQIEGVDVEEPDTNLVFFDIKATGVSVEELQKRLMAQGIMVSGLGGRVRACTHLDVTAAMIPEAVTAIREALAA